MIHISRRSALLCGFLILLLLSASCKETSMSGSGSASLSASELTLVDPGSMRDIFYKNAVMRGVADPGVMRTSSGKYYMVGTSLGNGFKIWPSDDLVRWGTSALALSNQPTYWGRTNYWAPEVYEYRSKYYMVYSALTSDERGMRIGLAVSDTPEGPYLNPEKSPFFDPGYAVIDAHLFFDENGSVYLYYSRDCSENKVNGRPESHCYVVKVKDDLSGVVGDAVLVAKPTEMYELYSGATVWTEAPYVIKYGSKYYLMYSTNCYANKYYSVCYATSDNPMGPFTKADGNPVLSMTSEQTGKVQVSGPGHNSVTTSPDDKELMMVYHTHATPTAPSGDRNVAVDRMGFRSDGSMFVSGPTRTYQPKPSGSSDYLNIAFQAYISRNGVKMGCELVDGEFAISTKKAAGEQVVSQGDTITLEFPRETELTAVLVYPGASKRVEGKINITIDGKYTITNLALPKSTDDSGVSALAAFDSVKGKIIKMEFTGLDTNQTSLSEIMVLGKQQKE